MSLFADNMWLPALALAVLGWVVPAVLARVMPEGVKALMLLGLVATFVVFAISALMFFALYVAQGANAGSLAQFGMLENLVFFGRLGLSSALIWAPILILSVANRPRHWVKETW